MKMIRNIYMDYTQKKTPELAKERVLCIIMCISVFVSFYATSFVNIGDNKYAAWRPLFSQTRSIWIFLMVLEAVLTVLLFFRLRKAALLTGVIMLLPFSFDMYSKFLGIAVSLDLVSISWAKISLSLEIYALFIMAVEALLICLFVHMFSTVDLSQVITVLSLILGGIVIAEIIVTYCTLRSIFSSEDFGVFTLASPGFGLVSTIMMVAVLVFTCVFLKKSK